MPATLLALSARIAPSRIGYLKFILEGYDGLAQLSTVDRNTGDIVVRCHPACQAELLALLTALGVDTQVK